MSNEETSEPVDAEFLVCYDYGTGGLWGVLLAPSEAAIQQRYPELLVVDEPPPWLTEEDLGKMRGDPLWLDGEPPQGLLAALVADRTRH